MKGGNQTPCDVYTQIAGNPAEIMFFYHLENITKLLFLTRSDKLAQPLAQLKKSYRQKAFDKLI